MFDKLQQLKQLKNLQDELKKQSFESDREGTRIVVNGSLQIEEIHLNEDLDKETQERVLKDCLNDAMRKAQMSMAQQFQGMM